jgi:hypothetical protein
MAGGNRGQGGGGSEKEEIGLAEKNAFLDVYKKNRASQGWCHSWREPLVTKRPKTQKNNNQIDAYSLLPCCLLRNAQKRDLEIKNTGARGGLGGTNKAEVQVTAFCVSIPL